MKTPILAFFLFPTLLLAASNGAWLRRVPDENHQQKNPLAGQVAAAATGKQLFLHNCSPCHGTDAMGRYGRPSLRSERIRKASDGDIAWMLEHGNPFKGMPPWSSLPQRQRWQIIAYLRTLPPIGRAMPR